MVLQIDPARTEDPEFAIEGDGERLRAHRVALLARGSAARVRAGRQARTGRQGGRAAALPPRDGAAAVGAPAQAGAARGAARRPAGRRRAAPALAPRSAPRRRRPMARPPAGVHAPPLRLGAEPAARAAAHVVRAVSQAGCRPRPTRPRRRRRAGEAEAAGPPAPRNLLVEDVSESALAKFREAFLGEVKRSRGQADWGMVFLPARRVEVAVGSVTFVYESQPKLMAGALRGAAARAERAGDEPGRPSDGGFVPRRGRPGGRGADGRSRAKRIGSRPRRWPSPPCRRCSTCSRPTSATSKR